MNKFARRVAAALVSVVAILGFAFVAAPASAHENDISSSFTATPSKFASGKVNTADVALTFTLQTNPVEYMIIELPSGYQFNHGPATLSEYNFYGPGNGSCGGIDTFVVSSLTSGGWLCQLDPAHPNRFKVQADGGAQFPTTEMTITLKAGAFTAATVRADTPGHIEIRTYIVSNPDTLDEHGRVAVTTLATTLPNTGVDAVTPTLIAFVLLAAGATAIFIARRRKA